MVNNRFLLSLPEGIYPVDYPLDYRTMTHSYRKPSGFWSSLADNSAHWRELAVRKLRPRIEHKNHMPFLQMVRGENRFNQILSDLDKTHTLIDGTTVTELTDRRWSDYVADLIKRDLT